MISFLIFLILIHNKQIFLAKCIQNNTYSMVPIKRTIFLPTVTVLKNTVRLIGIIEYGINDTYRK